MSYCINNFHFRPFIADRFGRKVAIIGGCILMIIAAGIQGASQNLASEFPYRGMTFQFDTQGF
jgi:MFS family permease